MAPPQACSLCLPQVFSAQLFLPKHPVVKGMVVCKGTDKLLVLVICDSGTCHEGHDEFDLRLQMLASLKICNHTEA